MEFAAATSPVSRAYFDSRAESAVYDHKGAIVESIIFGLVIRHLVLLADRTLFSFSLAT